MHSLRKSKYQNLLRMKETQHRHHKTIKLFVHESSFSSISINCSVQIKNKDSNNSFDYFKNSNDIMVVDDITKSKSSGSLQDQIVCSECINESIIDCVIDDNTVDFSAVPSPILVRKLDAGQSTSGYFFSDSPGIDEASPILNYNSNTEFSKTATNISSQTKVSDQGNISNRGTMNRSITGSSFCTCLPSTVSEGPTHFSADMVAALKRNDLALLLKSISFLRMVESKLCSVNGLGRDGNDLAGKLPLSIMFTALGIDDVLIDSAQAGGIFGTSDGFIKPLKEFVEIKGASAKKRETKESSKAKHQYEFNNIRLKETSWKHLFLVCRSQQPNDWFSMEEYQRCDFWLGYATRDRLLAELATESLTPSIVRATVTPGGKYPKNSLGRALTWVKFQDVTKEWFQYHVTVCRDPCGNVY